MNPAVSLALFAFGWRAAAGLLQHLPERHLPERP